MESRPEQYTRPDNLLESVGIDFKGLTEEERAMKGLLIEQCKSKGINPFEELKKIREEHPKMSLAEAIRELYGRLEKE